MRLLDIFNKIFGIDNNAEPLKPEHMSKGNLRDIRAYMVSRSCDLEITAEPVKGHKGYFKDIGFKVPEGASVYVIMHAQGNLKDAYEKYVQRPIDRDAIKQHVIKPQSAPDNAPA